MDEPTVESLEKFEQMKKTLKELDEKAELELEVIKQKKRKVRSSHSLGVRNSGLVS